MNDLRILFGGCAAPILPADFVNRSALKHSSWEGIDSTPKLEETWTFNCLTLNFAINYPDEIRKYVISAPTGTGKTENLISYCAMLPDNIKVLISTALIDEADKIASHINFEANRKKAVSYHSNSNHDMLIAATYPVVITTHAFYKKNYSGGAECNFMMNSRDLLVIDEALDTMKEVSVEDTSILRAYTIFLHLSKQQKFQQSPRFIKELKYLEQDYSTLINAPVGTNLISSDKLWNINNTDGIPSQILSIEFNKYEMFAEIIGNPNLDGETSTPLNKLGYVLKYSKILTGINDETLNAKIREELVGTINNLNQLKNRQVYVTSNNGNKSFNRVTDDMFKKPVVIFDATAQVSEVYKLRKKYYDDLHMVYRVANVRDYSNVALHTVIAKTGKREINIDVAASILKSLKLGAKTLIITHQDNEAFFEESFKNLFPTSKNTVEVVHWNAITGLNNWHDFDTCIIAGLNHKPRYYAQNRTLINTDTEDTAFGANQNKFNSSIEDTVMISEIIQAMNRIRIRKIINSTHEDDTEGKCNPANIYLTIPRGKNLIFKKYIQNEMPNIMIKDWNLTSVIVHENPTSHVSSVISYLNGNLQTGAKINVYDVRNTLKINTNSFKSMLGSNKEKQDDFKELLQDYGYDLIEVMEQDRRRRNKKLPTKYFFKII